LGQPELVDPALAAGGPVDGVVVDAHELAVLRHLDVELEAQAKLEAGPEIRQRVLGGVAQEAAVTDDQGTRFGRGGGLNGLDEGAEQQEGPTKCGHGRSAFFPGRERVRYASRRDRSYYATGPAARPPAFFVEPDAGGYYRWSPSWASSPTT